MDPKELLTADDRDNPSIYHYQQYLVKESSLASSSSFFLDGLGN